MNLFRRALILSHRYLGIALSLLVVMWFATGIVMMYAGGMPRLTPELRLERLPALDLAAVTLTPAEAADRGLVLGGGRTTLLTVMDRPAYRFGAGRPVTVFADTGDVLEELSVEQSRQIASRFVDRPLGDVQYAETLERIDQWTLLQSRQMPLHKFTVNDGAGTELYVQPQSGDVAMLTTRQSRMLAWMSTIPHWMYFTALRGNQPVWYRVVVWSSALVCVLAVLGLALGVAQYRRRKPLAAAIPYAGAMRWHYVTGAVFGIFTLTWAFSGLLSMEPFAWTQAEGLEIDREVFTGGPADLSAFPAMEPQAWSRLMDGRPIKEVEFTRIQDVNYYLVRHAPGGALDEGDRERLHQPYPVNGRRDPNRVLVSAAGLEVQREPFSVDSLVTRLRGALPEYPIEEQQLLTEYDSYYYSREGETPLPILRVKFADPAETWIYVDPEMSQVVASINSYNRVERWLYNGLHSMDFAFWYDSIAWDVAMIALSLGGLASSGIGLVLGVRRIRRGVVRTAAPAGLRTPAAAPDPVLPSPSALGQTSPPR
jgi:hypothetical protein